MSRNFHGILRKVPCKIDSISPEQFPGPETMGNFFSKVQNLLSQFGNKEAKILMLGLDEAGKTTMLIKLKLKDELETISTLPTIGFHVETLQPSKNLTLTVYDAGGQEKMRSLWKRYFQGTQGLIYVVDSSDINRIGEAKKELLNVISEEEFNGVPLLVIANKQDLPNALKASEIAERFGLKENDRNPWSVKETIATSGEGLCEALEYLVEMVNTFMHKS